MRAMTLAIVGVVLLYVAPLESQAPVQAPADPRTAVQQTLIDLYRAISDGDAARFRTLCTRDFQRLDRSELMSIDRAISVVTSSSKSDGARTDRLVFRSTRVVGNTASVVYVRTSTVKGGESVEQGRWEESAQLVRGAGRWRVALLHSTSLDTVSKPQVPGSKAKDPLPPWTKSLAAPPGESLKDIVDDGKDKQVATFFRLNEIREVESKIFISGSGYIEIKGGGTYLLRLEQSAGSVHRAHYHES